MTQDAIVLKTLNNGRAEVAVIRGTACGSNCGNCESCIYQNELHTEAINKAGAKRGQKVVLESRSSLIYKAEFLVYILPMLFLVAGYVCAYKFGASEGICILCGFLALVLSAVILVISQRNRKSIVHVITRIQE